MTSHFKFLRQINGIDKSCKTKPYDTRRLYKISGFLSIFKRTAYSLKLYVLPIVVLHLSFVIIIKLLFKGFQK